jgi:aminoacrylate hydrolase
LGGLGAFWNPVRALLASRFQVITFDHRGCGRSERPLHGHTIERLAEDVVAILDDVEVARADIVGHSTGGTIAQVLALDSSDRVRRIVASGSWARPDPYFTALFHNRIAVLKGAGSAAYMRQSQLLGYPPAWFNAHAGEMEQALESAASDLSPLPVALARLHMLLAFDRSAELPRLRVPTLVLAATDDGIIPVHQSRELAQLIPASVYHEIERGGHFFPRVYPDAYANTVTAFLDSPDASA